jgi:hypothetical protein
MAINPISINPHFKNQPPFQSNPKTAALSSEHSELLLDFTDDGAIMSGD